ncbi:MAG: VWA domain-containing protein [Nitrospinae bacterium]|nr:VWA domain-containing protein [Nitrospinota bacterium]MZH13231.1 VWA domain-containing protein [Nitrospinota bacterium]
MSLNFSSPFFLFGLLGISIPILIHLLTRRQQKHVRFSAVYLLFQSQKRSIKKSKPNRLLLLFLRCLGIALFSLALANPFFSLGSSEAFRNNSPSSYVFIFDDSFSMRSQVKEKNLFDLATQFLSKLLKQVPEGSEFSLVLASRPARIDQGWISQKGSFEKLVQNMRPSFQTTDIGHSLEKAANLLKTAKFKSKKLILLTDLDKNGWDKEIFSEIDPLPPIPLQVFNFSTLSLKQNQVAVESVQTHQEFLARSRILKIKTKIKNLSKENQRFPVSLILDNKSEKEVLLDIQAGQTISRDFSIQLRKGDPVHGQIKAGDDVLPVDSRRFFSHHPDQNIKVLVVDGDPGAVSHQSESFYLERALNPFSVSVSHIDPTISTLAELPLRKLSDFSVVILANVREFPIDYELELEDFVLRGGALIFGMGDQIDAKYYNEKLGNLLPVTLEAIQNIDKTHLLFKNIKHPVMQAFSAKAIEEMKDIPFKAIYTIQARNKKKFNVANWFTNKNPAVIETGMGKGKIVVFLSSLDRAWNDFPIQPTFLPWIQRWTQYAARGLENISYQNLLVGETYQQNNDEGRWVVQTPGGNLYQATTQDGKTTLTETLDPGIYSVFKIPEDYLQETITKLPLGSQPAGTFTVNVDTKESSPQKISEEDIKAFLPDLKVSIKNPNLIDSPLPSSEGKELATPLLLLVAGILLLEGWTVRRE